MSLCLWHSYRTMSQYGALIQTQKFTILKEVISNRTHLFCGTTGVMYNNHILFYYDKMVCTFKCPGVVTCILNKLRPFRDTSHTLTN